MVYMKTTIIKQIEYTQVNKSNSINSYKYLINITTNNKRINKPFYYDLSIFTILKTLKYLKKISSNQYKNSIKRLKQNKNLNIKIYSVIHYYLSTIKAHKTKTTISFLKRCDNKKFIILSYNNQKYKVFLKSKAYKNLYNIDINDLNKEFSLFMINKYNKFYGGVIKYKTIK